MRTHRCTICGRQAAWSSSWEWYGSVRDLDDANPIVKTCSPECRKAMTASDLERVLIILRHDPDHIVDPKRRFAEVDPSP